jgi:hypothetical protein
MKIKREIGKIVKTNGKRRPKNQDKRDSPRRTG